MRPISRAIAIGLLLLCSLAARATDFQLPENQQIVGVDKPVPLGELVTLTVNPVQKAPEHFLKATYDWKVFDGLKEKPVLQNGNTVFFGAGIKSKKLLAVVAATYLYAVKDKDGKVIEIGSKTRLMSAEVVIGDTPDVTPEPEPEQPETPVAGKFALAPFVYQSARSLVKPASRKGAKPLAAAFRKSAAEARSVNELLNKTKDANDAAIIGAGVSTDDWEAWGEALQEKLKVLFKAGKLKSLADYQQAWTEISDGLALVK